MSFGPWMSFPPLYATTSAPHSMSARMFSRGGVSAAASTMIGSPCLCAVRIVTFSGPSPRLASVKYTNATAAVRSFTAASISSSVNPSCVPTYTNFAPDT